MRTAFDSRYGTKQGRLLTPVGFPPPEGNALFVLGSDPKGFTATVSPGDSTEVFQTGTFGDATTVRAQARFRGPTANMEGDLQWIAQLRIDGVVVVERVIEPRRTVTVGDLGWCVAASHADEHRIGFRLMLRGTTTPSGPIELPAFYVDALVLDTGFSPRPQILNRNPAPNEERVATTTTIAIDLIDVGPDGVNEAATAVYVNGVLAFNGGVFESGWDGTDSASTAIDSHTRRIVVDPTTPFDSQEVVTVRVVSAVVGGTSLETTYSFTIADVAAPRVVSAIGSAEKAVRIVFSEPIDPATALAPTGYVFTRAQGAIAVPVVAVSVAALTEREFEVTLDQEITAGATYTATMSGQEDLAGNVVTAPTNAATFTGYVCPRPDDRDWTLFELLPQLNQEEDNGDLRLLMAVFQEIGDLLLCRIDRFTDIIDPDVAPISFVDAMLEDLGNPFDFQLSEIDRRRLSRVLVALYKQVGTGPGIIAAVRFFMSLEVTIDALGFAPLGLGDGELGDDDNEGTLILGSGNLTDMLTIQVTSPRALSAAERRQMLACANFMRTEREHIRIVEPEAPPETVDHLELGVSELGTQWILH